MSAGEERPSLDLGGRATGWWADHRQEVTVTTATTVLITAVLAGVATLWNVSTGERTARSDLVVLLVASAVSAIALAASVVRMTRKAALGVFEPGIRADLIPVIRDEVMSELAVQLGLSKIYPDFDSCKSDLLRDLENSPRISIFLQIGRTIIAGGTDFYDTLASISLQDRAQLRILHASRRSPYLTRRVALERNSSFNRWQDDLINAERKLAALSREREQSVQSRQHVEGYLWQLFIFEDHLYVQPYLAARRNSREAPVLRFSRFGPSGPPSDGVRVALGENHRSLYHAFSRYFDLKWDESRPESTSLDELIAEPERAVVAGCLRTRAGHYVFVIPRRYLAENCRDIRYHCPGGKPTAGEGLLAALHRELREELGVEVDVVSSPWVTRYVTSYVEQKPLRVTDKPQPAIVYNRIREDDPNLGASDQWIVAWDVSLRPADDGAPPKIRPRSEIGAVLYLSPELLNATATRRVSYREIQGAKDGSKLVVMQGLRFDAEKSAVPTGVASILASSSPECDPSVTNAE